MVSEGLLNEQDAFRRCCGRFRGWWMSAGDSTRRKAGKGDLTDWARVRWGHLDWTGLACTQLEPDDDTMLKPHGSRPTTRVTDREDTKQRR